MKLYNTLTRKIEEVAKKEHLNLYTCGPTVYNFAHIGNLRSYIMADLLYRALRYENYNPKWVMNITDIDDKTIKGAVAEFGEKASVIDLKKHTEKYFNAFLNDLHEVNVLADEITFIKVTDVVPQIQEYILELVNKGYAYKADDGSTYFSIEKYQKDFGDYGGLVGEKFLEGKKVGARVAVDEYEKDNLSDFALWKAWDEKSDAQIFWDHPLLGKGRPGWHIECSVINKIGFQGEVTDIHTGGVDLIFPHHTNEIAQSQPIYKPFVNIWSHCEHLQVDSKKMAKSLNNFYTLQDLKSKGFSGVDLRYLFLQSNFDVQQNFTLEALRAANTRLRHLDILVQISDVSQNFDRGMVSEIISDIDNNQNFAKALGQVSLLTNKIYKESGKNAGSILDIDKILGLGLGQISIPPEVNKFKEQRDIVKASKDFAKSDELRKQIEALGYEVMDTPEGQKIKRKIRL